MNVHDEQLLAFAANEPAEGVESLREALRTHGDSFRYQLMIARYLEEWAVSEEWFGQAVRDCGNPGFREQYEFGFVTALRKVAEQIRCGEWLPGGALFSKCDTPD